MLDGAGQFVLLLQRLRETVVRLGFVWREPEFFGKLEGGLGWLMVVEPGEAKVKAPIWIVWLQSNRFGKMDESLPGSALSDESYSQIAVRIRKIRFQPQGFGKLSDGFVHV